MKKYMNYIKIDKQMTWPLPDSDQDGPNWKLRYRPEALTDEDRYYLSSIVSAYNQFYLVLYLVRLQYHY